VRHGPGLRSPAADRAGGRMLAETPRAGEAAPQTAQAHPGRPIPASSGSAGIERSGPLCQYL